MHIRARDHAAPLAGDLLSAHRRPRRGHPYFHASPAILPVGTDLVPGRARGQQTFRRGENNHVFMTRDAWDAVLWASTIAWTIGGDLALPTVYIYSVQPIGPVRYRFVADEPGRYEWYASRAHVVRLVQTVIDGAID